MTDIRQVSQTATIYTGQVQTSNIVGNAPVSSEIASGIPGALPVITQMNDVALEFKATNMGEENIPDPRLFKFLADEFKLPEQVIRDVYKKLNDVYTTQEQVVTLVQKVLADIGTTSDTFSRVWTAYRTYTDSTTNSDQAIRDFGKTVQDVTTTADSFDRVWTAFRTYLDATSNQEELKADFAKVLADVATTQDSFDRVWTAFTSYTDTFTTQEQVQQSFEKVLEDLAHAPDLLTTDVGKYLADITALASLSYTVMLVGKTLEDQTIGFSDVLTRIVDFNRTFEDTAFMTDDFYGAANIDDDEYADVYKVVLEWLGITETFAVDVTKPDLVDVATSQEQIYNSPQIVKNDQTSNSDLQTSSTEPVKLDQTITSEQKSFDVVKPDRQDTASTQDQPAFDAEIVKSDTTSNSDLITTAWTVYRTYLDSTTNSEQTQFEFEKVLADLGVTLDEFSTVWTAYREYLDSTANSDLLQASFTKVLEDLLALQDTISLEPGKYNEDFIATSDDQYFDVNKPDLQDQAVAADTPAIETQKPFEDGISVAELLLTKLIGLTVNEIDYFLEDYIFDITDYTFKAVHATDQITDLVFAKQVEDLVDATDDFYGTATAGDDEYVTLDKVAVDYAGFYETFDRLVDYIRLFSDTSTLLDQLQFANTKVLVDQTSNQEFTSFDSSKTTSDQANTQETKLFDVAQTSADQASTAEQIAFAATTVYSDQATNTDDFNRFYEAVRIFTEQTQSSEFVQQLIERVSSDQSIFTDLVTRTVEKLTLEQTTTSDLQTIDVSVVYTDSIYSTDDFYGAANIDDDEYASVDKVVMDDAVTSETITTVADFYRTFLEVAATTDLATFNFAKSVLEIVATSETVAIDFSTSRTETAVTSETVSQDFSTARTETVTQSDLYTQSIEPAKYETVVSSETVNYDTSLQKLETAATSETISQDFSTPRTETAVTSEIYTSQWDAYKTFTENVLQSDVSTLDTAKPVTENTVTSDTQTFDTTKRPLDTTQTSETIGKDATTEFSELVDATDDFYGAATVGDDEYADFQKSLVDYATNSDLVTTLTDYQRSVNESQILSEVFAAVVNKALSDITNSSDTVTLLTNSTKLESVSTSQTISLTLQSYFSQDYVELGYTGETYTY